LQSLNEELETAKEELHPQSELITVNDELQAKNAALVQARDSQYRSRNRPPALMVLDYGLRSKMANRAFTGLFKCRRRKTEGPPSSSMRCAPVVGRSGFAGSAGRSVRGGSRFPDFGVEQDSQTWGAETWCWALTHQSSK